MYGLASRGRDRAALVSRLRPLDMSILVSCRVCAESLCLCESALPPARGALQVDHSVLLSPFPADSSHPMPCDQHLTLSHHSHRARHLARDPRVTSTTKHERNKKEKQKAALDLETRDFLESLVYSTDYLYRVCRVPTCTAYP